MDYLTTLRKSWGTDWRNPFRYAYSMMEPSPDVIFFLTDGVVRNPQETLAMVEANRHIPIMTIGFGNTAADSTELQMMSELTAA